jgi:error-prone DNA polymerase
MVDRYAELHCHSAFSFLDGASLPEELAVCAKKLGLHALALTDHDDLGGIVRFAHAASEIDLDAIIGAELTMEDDSHLTVLVEDSNGYKNLCHLITQARAIGNRGSPRTCFSNLFDHRSGLIVLSGCIHGKIPTLLAHHDDAGALSHLRQMHEVFGEKFFLELWNHQINQEAGIAKQLIKIADKYSIPWVVTNNAHYAYPEKRIIHDVLTCIKHEVTLASAGRRLRPNASWNLKSPKEMAFLWRNYPEGIRNTIVIANQCRFRHGSLRPPLPDFAVAEGSTQKGLLEKLVWEGAAKRYFNLTEKHIKQINHELSMINGLALAPYFLIMWDIVNFARLNGITVQGRGSAASSAVCYCLYITAVDPIGMDLLFERFLSEGRNEPPDIDLDIAHQEREKIIQYVYEKYGREHAAMVCEVITYRGRSAARDAARVLGFSQEQADKLSTAADHSEAQTAAFHLANGGALSAGLDPKDLKVKQLIKVIAGLHQLPRHRSIHVGGFVLSGELLGDIVPIEPASMHGRTVIQWDKDDLDLAGLIKIDLLGLGMLTMIQEGLKLVKKHRNFDIELGQLDMADQELYQMLQKADTVGLFQVESRAQMSILPKLNPKCFYDIVVSIAIVRPGPIQGNVIHPYLRRRRGLEAVNYLHPSFEPILKRTLGVTLFQEQGMRLASVASGFTPAQTDNLRRVMSHKRSQEKMDKLCVQLAEGMRERHYTEETIKAILMQLRAFANYGFPESHAASFSLLVYASAYLKRYFAPEFYCAILNAQPMGFYSPATLIRDAQRHGVEVLPPDLAHSIWDCILVPTPANSLHPLRLRLGIRSIQGLGRKAHEALENAFTTGGAFTSLNDVIERSGLNNNDLKILARAGAFETFHPDRRQALWETLLRLKKKVETPLLDLIEASLLAKAQSSNQFETISKTSKLPDMTPIEKIISDFDMMNLSTDDHLMSFYREWAKSKGIYSAIDLHSLPHGKKVTVAGGTICRQRPETAKGFMFLTLEDETGMANIIVNPDKFEQYRKVILGYSFLAITGILQSDDGVINVRAEHVEIMPALPGDPRLPSRNFQ